MISKGFTYEVMGEYGRAIATLQQAEPLVDQQADFRGWYMLRFNLAVNFTHLGRFHEAEQLLQAVRHVASEDKVNLLRVNWLEGRIAAGLGRTSEAQTSLAAARSGFAARNMVVDATLALLEEAAVLLEEGRRAEVKALAPELAKVLDSKEVHREALAALRLFQEAVESDAASAELARSMLRYLFRARYDQGLPFNAS